MTTWTDTYCQLSHYGKASDGYWASVQIADSFVELTKWFPGCGFNPIHEMFDTEVEAKSAGEAWTNQIKVRT